MMMPVRPLQQLVHGALYQLLGGRVEARRRLVQDDQAGVFQEDAGEGEQLRLARREPATRRTQLGIEAGGQRLEPASTCPGRAALQDALVGDGRVE